jgi:hypothetical protein
MVAAFAPSTAHAAPAPGHVAIIESKPEAALVFGDRHVPGTMGDFRGKTPLAVHVDPRLSYDFYLEQPGYADVHVHLARGQQKLLVELQPDAVVSYLSRELDRHANAVVLLFMGGLFVIALVLGRIFCRTNISSDHNTNNNDFFPDGQAPSAEPERIDDYLLTGLLGEGSFSRVYRASHVKYADTYALKLLRPEYMDEDGRARFAQEMVIGRDVRHKNLIRVYGYGEYHGSPYLVMDYLVGKSLEEVMSWNLMPLDALLDLFIQICDGLHHAHMHGIVHRDLKPGNVMLTDDGVIKLLDFGIARCAAKKITTTGMVLGTPLYMAPEQFRSQSDARSDIYSLGVMLFEALTGDMPVWGEDVVEIAMAHVEQPPPRVRSLRPGLPAELEDVVTRLLAKDPNHRYQSAAHVRLALQAVRASLHREQVDIEPSEQPDLDEVEHASV